MLLGVEGRRSTHWRSSLVRQTSCGRHQSWLRWTHASALEPLHTDGLFEITRVLAGGFYLVKGPECFEMPQRILQIAPHEALASGVRG
jgi:hypothetical protein